ncbi:hypothetical protein ACTA71_012455 [Dictyostelium dimigraforme]
MELIKNYLIASRCHANLGVLNYFSIGIAASYIENGGIFNYKICFFTLLVCIFINNIGFLMNSYLDYIFNVDSNSTIDKTLFGITSIKSLLNYILFSISMVFLIVFLIIPNQFPDLNNQVYKMIIIYSMTTLIMALIYNFFKYIALGSFAVSFVYFLNYMIAFNVNSNCSTLFQNNFFNPVNLYAIYIIMAGFQINHGNNHRDYDEDKKAGILTLSIIFGKKLSLLIFNSISIMVCLWSLFLVNYLKNFYFLSVLFIIPKITKLWISTNDGNTKLLNAKASDIHLTACPFIVFSILMSS